MNACALAPAHQPRARKLRACLAAGSGPGEAVEAGLAGIQNLPRSREYPSSPKQSR